MRIGFRKLWRFLVAAFAVFGALVAGMLVFALVFLLFMHEPDPRPEPAPELALLLQRAEQAVRDLSPGETIAVDLPTLGGEDRILVANGSYSVVTPPKEGFPDAVNSKIDLWSMRGLTAVGLFLVRDGRVQGLMETDLCNLQARRTTETIITADHRQAVIRCEAPASFHLSCDAAWNPRCAAVIVDLQ